MFVSATQVEAGANALRAEMQSWKKDVESKFGEFLESSKAQSAAIEELRLMFNAYIGKPKERDEGSPSIGQSALENWESLPQPSTEGARDPPMTEAAGTATKSKKKGSPLASLTGKGQPLATKKQGTGVAAPKKNATTCMAKAAEITLCNSELELTPEETPSQTAAPTSPDWKVAQRNASKAVAEPAKEPAQEVGVPIVTGPSQESLEELSMTKESLPTLATPTSPMKNKTIAEKEAVVEPSANEVTPEACESAPPKCPVGEDEGMATPSSGGLSTASSNVRRSMLLRKGRHGGRYPKVQEVLSIRESIP